jgi:hypothetical protein
MSKAKNENIGKFAVDQLTGFEGVAFGFCQHLVGCDSYMLIPRGEKKHERNKGEWFDRERLTFKEDKEKVVL